jgi:hypothetical protein
MNTQQEYKDDPLRNFIDSRMVEKASPDFTGNVMTRVSMEARPLRTAGRFRKVRVVPLISVSVTLILIAAALLLPSGSYKSTFFPWIQTAHNFILPVLKINLDALLTFKVPGYLPYLFICVLFLTIFDKALSGLFHRE